jgi:hypothetical protein
MPPATQLGQHRCSLFPGCRLAQKPFSRNDDGVGADNHSPSVPAGCFSCFQACHSDYIPWRRFIGTAGGFQNLAGIDMELHSEPGKYLFPAWRRGSQDPFSFAGHNLNAFGRLKSGTRPF